MPRGGARPKSPGFSKAIAASNKMRGFANREQKMLAAQRLSHQKVFGGSVPMRVDEASLFAGGGSGLDLEPRLRQGSCRIRCRSARPKQPNGVRTDQQFTAQAICIAGMTHKETDAKTKTGMSQASAVRCQFIAVDALASEQSAFVDRNFTCPRTAFKIYKHSKDESPFKCRDTDGAIRSCKLLNRRVHLRFGRGELEQCALVVPGCEMDTTDVLGTVEATERSLPCCAIPQLQKACDRTKHMFIMELGDNLSTNTSYCKLMHHELPRAKLWPQRCDSHTCCLVTNRPFTVHEVSGPIFSYTRLSRQKACKEGLANAMEDLVRKELPRNRSFLPADQQSVLLSRICMDYCIAPILQWSDAAEQADVLQRLASIKAVVRDNASMFMEMFNKMSSDAVAHACHLDDTGTPCCASLQECLRKMLMGLQVIQALLCSGNPEPSEGKWFSLAWRLRSFLLGLVAHRLLPRSWRRRFANVLRQAIRHNARDEIAALDRDYQSEKRIRHRKVDQFWDRPDLIGLLLSLIVAISPVERLHFTLYTSDIARAASQHEVRFVEVFQGSSTRRSEK